MDEQEEFLSPEHNKLLNVAIWAKYLAWVVLVIYIALTALAVFNNQINFQQMEIAFGSSQNIYHSYWDLIWAEPYYLIVIGSDMISIFIRGVVYYVVLKGISLGLYMIVETDINYREQKNQDSFR